ncbi:MAG: ABC transporter permease [Kiritimatiellaeota bacterium]|nr:ABC transporter permease [Kiritimatiellota bacterium]
MIAYILRRTLLGVPIILGVLLVTFVLFHGVAGDPAALMAGKNASPRELEELRRQLRLDRPLLFGHWRRTELFRPASFATGPDRFGDWPGTVWRGPAPHGVLRLMPGAALRIRREWPETTPERLRCTVEFRGSLRVLDAGFQSTRWRRVRLPLPANVRAVTLTAGVAGADLRGISVQRRQTNPLDSQFLATLQEVVDLRRNPVSGRLRLSFFNFGETLLTHEPIRRVLLRGLGPSLALTVPIFIVELLLAIGIAMVSAFWRDTWVDRSLVILSVAGMSISYLVYILLGQYFLAYYWNLFPVWGCESWRNFVLPVLVGVASGMGGSVRFYRTVFLNEIYRDHIRTARSKGCSTLRIMTAHVLPNALIPIITRIAVVLPFLYTGSLLLESFFGIPGLGYAGVGALANADLQLLKALVLVGALMFVAANIFADVAYALVDPRVRLN